MKRYEIKVLLAIAAVCAALFWPSCQKVETDITYNVVAYLDLPEVDTLIPYSKYVRIFAHERDTAGWWVASYEDAAQGIITSRIDRDPGTSKDVLTTGYPNADTTAIVVGPFARGPVMLVAYDTERHSFYESKMYAWREVAVEPGVGQVRIAFVFAPEGSARSWINEERNPDSRMYENSRWFIANDNPWVEPEDDDDDDGEDEDGSNGGGGGGR